MPPSLYRPLYLVEKLLAHTGLTITYAYDDLVFQDKEPNLLLNYQSSH